MIDPHVQAELRARFNPDDSDLRKMQLRMLEMLKYIDKISRENNIKYWLSSGTCLGAVRHGGFIPWDDDCDIEMFREDYKKLRTAILRDSDCPYIWQDHHTDFAYLAPYAKLRDSLSKLDEVTFLDKDYKYHGIYIDIFIIESSNSKTIRRIGDYIQFYGLFKLNLIKNKSLKRLLIGINWKIIHSLIFPILKFIEINPLNKTRYRHTLGSMFLKPRDKTTIGNPKCISFEGQSLPVPEKYESYLSAIYGDIHKLPDLSKLHSHITSIEFYEEDNARVWDSPGGYKNGSACQGVSEISR